MCRLAHHEIHKSVSDTSASQVLTLILCLQTQAIKFDKPEADKRSFRTESSWYIIHISLSTNQHGSRNSKKMRGSFLTESIMNQISQRQLTNLETNNKGLQPVHHFTSATFYMPTESWTYDTGNARVRHGTMTHTTQWSQQVRGYRP